MSIILFCGAKNDNVSISKQIDFQVSIVIFTLKIDLTDEIKTIICTTLFEHLNQLGNIISLKFNNCDIVDLRIQYVAGWYSQLHRFMEAMIAICILPISNYC